MRLLRNFFRRSRNVTASQGPPRRKCLDVRDAVANAEQAVSKFDVAGFKSAMEAAETGSLFDVQTSNFQEVTGLSREVDVNSRFGSDLHNKAGDQAAD